MVRRIHVSAVSPGKIPLDAGQARHARDVLRLAGGTSVEVFDDAGNVGAAQVVIGAGGEVAVDVASVTSRSDAPDGSIAWTVAAAVPKGERADWMIEKLSELGTAEFIPLAAARSVVVPRGQNKRDRWVRIATESAKQCRRAGVMRVGELTSVDDVVARVKSSEATAGLYFSTRPDARPVAEIVATHPPKVGEIVALIGPEGGWSDDELSRFAAAGLTEARLTPTVLRVETAAVAAAAVIALLTAPAA